MYSLKLLYAGKQAKMNVWFSTNALALLVDR